MQTSSKAQLIKKIRSKEVSALKAREKTAKIVETATAVGGSALVAFGVSYIDQKQGGPEGWAILGPLTFPAVAGLGFLAIGASGMAKGLSKPALIAAYGSLNAWASHAGRAAAA